MRKAFADTLFHCALENEKVMLLTGDLGYQLFDSFDETFTGRFINVGVAEAQMMSAAAGLAVEGYKPVAYSIASFATARPFEQIRYCIGYPQLPVLIVGAGRGLLYGQSGVSHHAMDDVALMSAIPGMTVVLPGDKYELAALLPQLLELDSPSYMTVGRYGEPTYTAEEKIRLGRIRLLRSGEKLTLFSTGEIANEVVNAVDILNQSGIFPKAYQVHTVKPLDFECLESEAELSDVFVVIEEHLPQGSLWSAIAQWKAEHNSPIELVRIGPPDAFLLGNKRRDEYRRNYSMDTDGLVIKISEIWVDYEL
ncbi:MAG: transketolase family protein [Fidelibacterota bacterium]